MGTFSSNETSIEGDAYIQRLATYIRRNEEALANGLLCFSKNRSSSNVKPLRLSFTIHHLYYITERIESSPLGVDVGPLNVKVDNPNHEPTFISFLANNARSSRHFDSDTRSISSINSVKSIISSASVYWRSSPLKDPKLINKDIKYLYSSFTKIPCLILTPKTKVGSISGYEEFPCDTLVPMKMFKNLQVLELVDYEPNEIFGWHILSEQLRILIIRNSKISNIAEVMFNLVIDDENGRSTFNSHKQQRKYTDEFDDDNTAFRYPRRERATTTASLSGAGSLPKDIYLLEHLMSTSAVPITLIPNSNHSTTNFGPHSYSGISAMPGNVPQREYSTLPDHKWNLLKQLTVSDTLIMTIPGFIFKPLSNLVKLNLSNNLLEALPEGLDQLTNIKFMNFADNYITSLHGLPKGLKHLTTLNLNNNKIEDLTGLEHLCNLEKVDLRRNRLSTIASLRPIVLLFMKNPAKLNSVYLSSNKLPKNYRIELFNLINGVKYKNNFKLDDSRPGYFESALLLDAEQAFKALEEFFNSKSTNDKKENPANVHVAEINLYDEIVNNGSNIPLSPPSPKTPPPLQPSTRGHRRSHTLEALMEPFSVLSVTTDSAPKKKFDLSHTVLSSSPVSNGPSSPLSNSTAKFDAASYTSRSTLPCHVNSEIPSPSTVSTLKKSLTLTQLEFEPLQSTTNTVLTTLQVTARMST